MSIVLPSHFGSDTTASFSLSEDGLMVTTKTSTRKTYLSGGLITAIPANAINLLAGEYSANRYCDLYLWMEDAEFTLIGYLPRGLNSRWVIIAQGDACKEIVDLFPDEIKGQIPFLRS